MVDEEGDEERNGREAAERRAFLGGRWTTLARSHSPSHTTSSCFFADGRRPTPLMCAGNFVTRLDVVADEVELGQAPSAHVFFGPAPRAGDTRGRIGGDDFPLDVLRKPREQPIPSMAAGPGGPARGCLLPQP